jgi:hypothetical protein
VAAVPRGASVAQNVRPATQLHGPIMYSAFSLWRALKPILLIKTRLAAAVATATERGLRSCWLQRLVLVRQLP